MRRKTYTTRSGRQVTVDISDEAFKKAGFDEIRHGDKILDPNGDRATAIGLENKNNRQSVLWYRLERDRGISLFSSSSPSDYKKI